MKFIHVGELSKRTAVAEGDVDDTVVRERRDRADDGSFLSASWCTRGDEHARKLAYQTTCGPESASPVPKDLSKGGKQHEDQISNPR